MGFHFGISQVVNKITSLVSRIEGAGGNTWVPRERYSLMMSFCVVPCSVPRATPCSSASAT